MKILYAAYRHDPRDPDAASGADFNFHRSLGERGHEIHLSGPITGLASPWERALRRVYRKVTGKRYAKFPHSLTRRASAKLNRAEGEAGADVIFTLFQPALVFYRGKTPCVFRLDTSFSGYQRGYREFGDWALDLSLWQERRAFARCTRLITHSHWSARGLVSDYGLDPNRIAVIPNPSGLPEEVIPKASAPRPPLRPPLQLLTVGRDFHRKGIDVAQATVHRLNQGGIEARLTVCGLAGNDDAYTRFVGPYRKSQPGELQQYLELYRQAQLLLHPARFDPSPIVTAEAAAFGLPVITRDVGGIATSVADGESGIVLSPEATADDFAQAIQTLVSAEDRYHSLSRGARQRYETDLNWTVAAGRVEGVLQAAAREARAGAAA